MMSEKRKKKKKKNGCVIFVVASGAEKVCLRPAVLPLHPAAGGGADVHPRALLEVLRRAAAAVGPELHHGRAGPLLQPGGHAGQTNGRVRTDRL